MINWLCEKKKKRGRTDGLPPLFIMDTVCKKNQSRRHAVSFVIFLNNDSQLSIDTSIKFFKLLVDFFVIAIYTVIAISFWRKTADVCCLKRRLILSNC